MCPTDASRTSFAALVRGKGVHGVRPQTASACQTVGGAEPEALLAWQEEMETGAARSGAADSGRAGGPVRKRAEPEAPALDSAARHAAQLAPPALAAGVGPVERASTEGVARCVSASLEDLLPALVRRVGWSGDGRRGTVRLELGAGELAGATLLVHADDGRVRVHLSAPGAVDLGRWRQRLAERLAARGLHVDDVEVE
jgi:hypothetical protein